MSNAVSINGITVSKWTPVSQLPAQPGLYQVLVNGRRDNIFFSWFDGTKFGWVALSPDGAYVSRHKPTVAEFDLWRGQVCQAQ